MIFRWCALGVVLFAVGTSAYYRRRARAEGGVIPRSRESPSLQRGRALVALPLFGAALAYLIRPELARTGRLLPRG